MGYGRHGPFPAGSQREHDHIQSFPQPPATTGVTTANPEPPSLDTLSLPTGQFAMVALDQRESLATMLRDRGLSDSDADMTDLKLDLVRALAPVASGLLIDAQHGFDRVSNDGMLPKSCGLILAADRLTQERGGPVADTFIDDRVDPAAARSAGAVALKLLVIWRADHRRDRLVAMADSFIRRCRASGLLSVLEPVAPPAGTDFDLNAAILDAATALAPLRPDIYKAQVPHAGRGEFGELIAACARLDALVPVPWVVLSNGVRPDDFPRAVEAACRGGASGMLAGRAVWTSALGATHRAAAVTAAARRLAELAEIVTEQGRPWRSG